MPSTPTTDHSWSARLWWTLVGVMLLGRAFQIINYAPNFSWAAWAALICGGWGLGTVIVSWVPRAATLRARSRANVFAWLTAILTLVGFVAWAAIQVHNAPAYGTDELAFDQYAGQLAQHGLDPYTHSMGPAFDMFRVSPGGYTFTLTGAKVTQLSYPALSFLMYVPFLALGWSSQLGVGLDVLGWSIATLLIFRFLPRPLRPAALLLGGAVTYTQLSVIGLTDMLFMPLLVVAAYRWDRFGRDWRSYIGPVAFGLAMAVKQTPWPILPFILLALALDERERAGLKAGAERAGRYLATVVCAFLVPNLPYVIAAPSAWVRGTFTPIFKSLVPAGQGAIDFSLFLHVGGGSLFAFTALFTLVFVLLLMTYVATFPLLRGLTFVLPAVAYFFAVRSYAAYLVALIPPGMVAAITAEQLPLPEVSGLVRSRAWKLGIMAMAAACVIAAVFALSSRSPLSVTITEVDTTGADNIAQAISVSVTNRSGSPVSPAFTLETASGVSTFWNIANGPKRLLPGRSASYTLTSPDAASQFSADKGLTVLAFLSKSASVSVSNRYQPAIWHVGFDPESVDRLVPVGHSLVLHAQLLNEWNEPIHKQDVPVTTVQSVFGGEKIASINGQKVGAAVTTYTNQNGVVTLTIVGKQTSFWELTLTATVPPLEAEALGYQTGPSDPIQLRFAQH